MFFKGPRRFSSVVRIDTIQPGDAEARHYATLFTTASPTTAGDANDLAMQYGKDIVDGNAQASELWLNASQSTAEVEQHMQYPLYVHRDGNTAFAPLGNLGAHKQRCLSR